MANWNDFIASPLRAARQMHINDRDVKRGAQLDEQRRQRELEAQKKSPMYPSRENAAALNERGSLRDAMFFNALLRGPEQSATASPSRAEQIARAALSGAGSFGGWAEEPVNEPTPDMLARFAGQAVSDPLNAVGLGALKYAGQLAKRALPTATALGASAYASDAEAASRYDPRAFLRYVQQRFPDMLPSAREGMKFTADTGREAGVYGLLDDNLRIQPYELLHGASNSITIPADLRRKLIDSPNAFDMHTHPSGNALPSTPLNNASQNPLGGDTEYYQRTSRGTPWLRPGKADNLIVSVQPRAVREPLEFGNGRGESWTHMKMSEYPGKQELKSLDEYLINNADRYEDMLPMGDIGMMLPEDVNTFALLKHYADTGRGDFTYNLGKEVFGPGGREPATPTYEAIYEQLRKDKQLRNYAGGGSIAGAAKRLAQRAMPAFMEGAAPTMAPRGALSVVKPKGGNWINNSVEDALKDLRKLNPEGLYDSPINSWIDGPLTKYVKNRMASPDDEVRRLAEQGVLHYDPGSSVDRLTTTLARNNRWTGHAITDQTPTELTGISQLGRLWEQVSDAAVEPKRVGDTFRSFMRGSPDEAWLSKVPDDSVVYRMVDALPQEAFSPHLGFNHLIDELTNALNPASGLPQHLQLSPEAVKNMSMEKAVRRVADINDWRAANLAEHNRQLAEQASLVRDYPHSDATPNPRGLRWVELKKGEVPTEGNIDALYSADEAAKKALADQLKYEGDTMGHCVGGYCDNVLSGRSRIFSLRDAKGEPHVTVEVQPKWNNKMGDGSATEDAIVQIKGKQNKKPNDEYLPFVQDFVKNPPHGQPWGDVGDLQNTGLRNLKTLGDEPLVKAAREKLGDYATHEEWDTFGNEFLKNKRGFASGGPVTQKDSHPAQNIQGIIAAIREYHAHA